MWPLCFLCPRPTAALISAFYDRNYFIEAGPCTGCGYVDYATPAGCFEMLRSAKRRLAFFERYLDPRGKRCLQMGCATCEFCHILRQAGASPCGVDLSGYAIREARGRYSRLDFRAAALTDAPAEEQFDIVVALEVMEHAISPNALFDSVRRRLLRGGLFLLTKPNFDCARRLGADHWWGFSLSFERLHFFTAVTLSRYGSLQECARLSGYLGAQMAEYRITKRLRVGAPAGG